jgi:hypothetical protein
MEQRINLTEWKGQVDLGYFGGTIPVNTERAKTELGREIVRKVLKEFLGKEPTDEDFKKVEGAVPPEATSMGIAYDKAILGTLLWKTEGNIFKMVFEPNPRLYRYVNGGR